MYFFSGVKVRRPVKPVLCVPGGRAAVNEQYWN